MSQDAGPNSLEVDQYMNTSRKVTRLSPGKESYILLAICLVDLLITLWLVSTHRATEGNPIMAFYLKQGLGTLITVKLIFVLLPLFIAEWGRIYRPEFVRHILRLAILLYAGIFALAFVNTNILASACSVLPR